MPPLRSSMPSTIEAEKAALRRALRSACLSPFEKAKSDRLLLARFLALPQVISASTLLLFYGVGPEPETAQLLAPLQRMGKQVALPRCLINGQMEARQYLGPEHLASGSYGIPEPDDFCPRLSRDRLDVILVPNLCCDISGYRLGHGGGYYDRYLSGTSAFTVALCRDSLVQQALPRQAHDLPVDLVLTETRSLSRI